MQELTQKEIIELLKENLKGIEDKKIATLEKKIKTLENQLEKKDKKIYKAKRMALSLKQSEIFKAL